MNQIDDLVQIIWQGLKNEACVHPETAVTIVTLHKDDIKKMIEKNLDKIENIIRDY